ncbi:hypothetical protein C7999DRAFT_36441 [Corynascus novoguineensis]|uniref:Lariat debranching enzyme C-terminal domain-containing protein n=1 Tax=Corynascus novoguineensis TaxID=1126955 RepID=A0AAN7CLZ8_9PEZI|nr:hypothetical protein C7999DRAFT_36441 [Corynascus novoguineensis]
MLRGIGASGGNGGRFDLCYDEEWLAITRAYNDTLYVQDPETLVVPPDKTRGKTPPTGSIAKHRNWVRRNIVEEGLLAVPRNFDMYTPVEDTAGDGRDEGDAERASEYADGAIREAPVNGEHVCFGWYE